MKNNPGVGWGVLAGIIASVTFLIFLFCLRTALLIAAGAAVLVYIALVLLIPGLQRRKLVLSVAGIPLEAVEQAVSEGREQVAQIAKCAARIRSQAVKQKIAQINVVAEKIFDCLLKSPESYSSAKKFLQYYLQTTLRIVTLYADLSEQLGESPDPDTKQTLQKVEDILSTIERTVEKQLVKVLANDLLELDTEVSVLEKTIKMEGL